MLVMEKEEEKKKKRSVVSFAIFTDHLEVEHRSDLFFTDRPTLRERVEAIFKKFAPPRGKKMRPDHIETYFRRGYDDIDINRVTEVLWTNKYCINYVDEYMFAWTVDYTKYIWKDESENGFINKSVQFS